MEFVLYICVNTSFFFGWHHWYTTNAFGFSNHVTQVDCNNVSNCLWDYRKKYNPHYLFRLVMYYRIVNSIHWTYCKIGAFEYESNMFALIAMNFFALYSHGFYLLHIYSLYYTSQVYVWIEILYLYRCCARYLYRPLMSMLILIYGLFRHCARWPNREASFRAARRLYSAINWLHDIECKFVVTKETKK